MRTIKRPVSFKRDYKREAKRLGRTVLDGILVSVLVELASDKPLAPRFCDHKLSGNWEGFRECHIKPDLLLIYCKVDDDNSLTVARLGSHSDMFG